MLVLPSDLPFIERAEALDLKGQELLMRHEFVAAEECFRQALSIQETFFPPEHPGYVKLGPTLYRLAIALDDQGKAEAEMMFRRALSILELKGPQHQDLAPVLIRLSLLKARQANLSEAEGLIRRALDVQQSAKSKEGHGLADILENLASLLVEQGKVEEAEQRYKESIAARFPEDTSGFSTARTRRLLAYLLLSQRRYGEAENVLAEAFAAIKEARGPLVAPHHADTLEAIADLYNARGNPSTALRLQRLALEIREPALGRGHPLSVSTRSKCGELERRISEAPPTGTDSTDVPDWLRSSLEPKKMSIWRRLSGWREFR